MSPFERFWPIYLTLKDDLDLYLSQLKMCSSMRYTWMPNIKLISSILQKLWFWPIYLTFDLEGWPLPFTTQNVELHEIHMHAKYQVAIFNIAKVMANVKVWAILTPYIWPLTLKDDLWHWKMTLTFHHSKCARSMRYTCMPNIKLLSSILQKLWPMLKFERFWPIYLTFDLEEWPWPFTTQNVQLYEIHMHAKYQAAIFNIAKVMANVKGCTNQQILQTGQKQYVPQYSLGDIKRKWFFVNISENIYN